MPATAVVAADNINEVLAFLDHGPLVMMAVMA